MTIGTNIAPRMVLIGGAQRTGTTLCQTALCTAPGTNPMLQEAEHLTALIATYFRGRTILWEKARDYFTDPDALRALYRDYLTEYVARIIAHIGPVETLVLKDPFISKFPEVFDLWDDLSMICMARDPRDTIASMIAVAEKAAHTGTTRFWSRDIDRYCAHFLEFYRPVADFEHPRFFFLRYEDMVGMPQAFATKLSEVTGLEVDAAHWVAGIETGTFRYTDIWQARDPREGVNAGSVARFRGVLSEPEIATIEDRLKTFMENFGYPLTA